jgi:hypothetical protein
MKNQYKNEIDQLIENFMIDYHSPETSDWKALIDAHPEHAGTIADAALFHRNSANLEDVANDWALNQSVFNNTISMVQNLVHQMPSPVLADAKRRVAAIQGPIVKKVATELGIGPYPSLLSGILVGRTLAPKSIGEALAARLEVPLSTLTELFRRTFFETEVPAFKSPDSQPQLATKPATWEQAVNSLKLTPDESARLIKMSDEA